ERQAGQPAALGAATDACPERGASGGARARRHAIEPLRDAVGMLPEPTTGRLPRFQMFGENGIHQGVFRFQVEAQIVQEAADVVASTRITTADGRPDLRTAVVWPEPLVTTAQVDDAPAQVHRMRLP